MKRFLAFLRLVLVLTTLMFSTWLLSMAILPQGLLRPYFSRLFSARVNEFAFGPVLLANLLPFFGVQFMNLFRVGKLAGGLYILPIFWIIVGLLYGTNSFVFADRPVAFSITVVWARTGFMELLAYTTGYEATKGWWLWEQRGLLNTPRLTDKHWKLHKEDGVYWIVGLLLLVFAAAREVQ